MKAAPRLGRLFLLSNKMAATLQVPAWFCLRPARLGRTWSLKIKIPPLPSSSCSGCFHLCSRLGEDPPPESVLG